ncbi:MAG TPA: pyridoxamine 5'-phosphate oxidase [Thermoanaerobaculia bacterium]|jgi:pyridoxamine 5'-phosphate oxidase|nr:pyridoxamine 5'-phosphate oxidase [Thermoanaerobaculia bacterium]
MPERRDPFARFAELYRAAIASGIKNPNAMTLSTVGPDGAPSSRQVLLKHFDPDGFVFYTNLESRKARQIAANPRVSLNFYWREIDRQVIVEGRAEPVSAAEANAYFASRDRGSQIGAWASRQSRPLQSRSVLVGEVADLEREYQGRKVPRPPFWSGLRVVPQYFEFWAEGVDRLHDRFAFERTATGWRSRRLYP